MTATARYWTLKKRLSIAIFCMSAEQKEAIANRWRKWADRTAAYDNAYAERQTK